MESRTIKIPAPVNNSVILKVIPGHFATNHSHINYYLDMMTMCTRQSEAEAVAKTMAASYGSFDQVVDTIVCLDGTAVIAAYLAQELSKAGIMNRNAHKTIYIVTPEYNNAGQMIFRDNMTQTIEGKHIILLVASATTGKTINRSLECINYYGGTVTGISAIFSAVDAVGGYNVESIFKPKDIPGYATYASPECPYCKKNMKIEAIVNGFGYSKL